MRRVLGITAEYDPFHRGHAWHIERAKEEVRPDAVVCVMSGDFTQRGLPAVLDKWVRAEIAVRQGVDLVFELPFMYACSRAGRFAAGAVDLLAGAGVSHISFGCEAEHPEDLQKLADGQAAKETMIRSLTSEYMKSGYSRVKASELAVREILGDRQAELMLSPNNILALEYMKRARTLEEEKGVRLRPVPVRRHAAGYDEANMPEGFAGGSAIRRMIRSGQDAAEYLGYDGSGLAWVDQGAAEDRLYYQVRGSILRMGARRLAQIYCVGEGMEHRLISQAARCESYDEFLSSMVSRRYTAATMRRIMIYILMGLHEMPDCAPYGRVLAASGTGRGLLRELADRKDPDQPAPLTVISNSNRLQDLPEEIREAVKIDARAADMFNLICARPLDPCRDARRRPWMKE